MTALICWRSCWIPLAHRGPFKRHVDQLGAIEQLAKPVDLRLDAERRPKQSAVDGAGLHRCINLSALTDCDNRCIPFRIQTVMSKNQTCDEIKGGAIGAALRTFPLSSVI